MVTQSPVPTSGVKLPPPADVEEEVTPVPTTPSDGAPRTTGTAVRVNKFVVARYRHENLLVRVNQINNPEIPLCDINDGRVLSLVQSIHAYLFHLARGTLSVMTTITATSSKAS